jgi:TRAP-type mannitol/chloroaromatic compound transport system permease small subunit
LTFFIGFFLLALQGLAELIKCFEFLTGRSTEWDPDSG